jgi:hypothetical protein
MRIAFVLALAAVSSAQTSHSIAKPVIPKWQPGNCQSPLRQKVLAERKKQDKLFAGYHIESLTRLNEVLRKYSGLHDAYLHAGEIGNEETVPLLLNRLRLDFGDTEPVDRTRGIDCAQGHLALALREITNTDMGVYYPKWAAWWEANRTFPREKWILDGFAAGGLHPVFPVDQRFGFELIEALLSDRFYYPMNARRLLASVPAETRGRWLDEAAMSAQRPLRLGALSALSDFDGIGHEDLLRSLSHDPDEEVRRRALTVINERLKQSVATKPPVDGCFCGIADGVQSVSFAGNLLIVAYGDRFARSTRKHGVKPGARPRVFR